MKAIIYDKTLTATYTPIAVATGFSGTITAHENNGETTIDIRVVGESVGSTLVAGEYIPLTAINLGTIEVKGLGAVLKISGVTNDGWL